MFTKVKQNLEIRGVPCIMCGYKLTIAGIPQTAIKKETTHKKGGSACYNRDMWRLGESNP